MKLAIRIALWVTTILTVFGCFMLLNDGNFDVYAFWNASVLIAALYYIEKWSK